MLETAIIGAGPYGLSIAAHLRHRGISFRIFGRLMDSWKAHMPKGMCLKSDGFASSIYDPERRFTLRQYCAERGIKYADSGIPVRLDTFSAYGEAFKDRMVPELEDKLVTSVERSSEGFRIGLDSGETFTARRVIMAVGITHFEHTPADLASLPAEFVSHSFRHHDLEKFRDRRVIVIGGGSSSTDVAGLLKDAGADVELVSRRSELKFHGAPKIGQPRSMWENLSRPQSGIGPGWRLRFFANSPNAFYYLPEGLRLEAVRRVLGPSGPWFMKDRVIGRVPVHLGCTPERAEVKQGRACLRLRAADGSQRELIADHVIAATGYKVNLDRLKFLSSEMRSQVELVGGSPSLSSKFESSVPGLYFAGVAAANSFGPVMRFAFGAGFAARTIARAISKSAAHSSSASTTRHELHEIKVPDVREKAGAANGSTR